MYEGGGSNDRIRDKYADDAGNYSYNSGIMNKSRGCTDILCLAVFLTFVGSLGYLTYYSYHNGDVQKILAPVYYDA